MQPVFPYTPQSYPPSGRFPQFGDEVLQETLSLGEGVRRSLNRKREGMSEFHREIVERHGLAPRPESLPVPDDEEFYDAPPQPPQPGNQPPDERRRGSRAPPELQRPNLSGGPADDPMRPRRYYIGGDDVPRAEPRVELQGGLGRPPDFPGSGAVALRNREYFRTPQQGPGGLPDVQMVGGGGGGGPPPQPPGAGAVVIPPYAAGPADPEEEAYTYPPGDAPGPAPQPRARATPYDRKRITGKSTPKPPFEDDFFNPPESMDTAASAPAAITAMEEQNTGVKRAKEDAPAPKKKPARKKKDEVVATQSPPSLPPPPPGGAAALKVATPSETAEPDVEPASASVAGAPTSVPHYRQKEEMASSSSRRKPPPPDAVIDDLPAVPVKRKTKKPLEDDTPAALRPDRQRPRAPAAEPDAEPTPLNPGGSSSSSRRLSVANQRLW
jgi:hypothetical protein